MSEVDEKHEHDDNKVERIDKSTLTPLNDPNCPHEWVDDPEIIGAMRAQTCLHCPVGRWVKYEVS